jgi:hypothetical protein
LALAYWVEHGEPPPDGLDSVKQQSKSICSEWSWPDSGSSKWTRFYTVRLHFGHQRQFYISCSRIPMQCSGMNFAIAFEKMYSNYLLVNSILRIGRSAKNRTSCRCYFVFSLRYYRSSKWNISLTYFAWLGGFLPHVSETLTQSCLYCSNNIS